LEGIREGINQDPRNTFLLTPRTLQILKRDRVSREKTPGVIREESNDKNAAETTSFENLLALGQMQNIANGRAIDDPVDLGHTFGLPELPLASERNLHHRYNEVVSQVTNLLMKDGKKSVAQRVRSSVSLWFSSALYLSPTIAAAQFPLSQSNPKGRG
jgi:hypothetical protein